MQLIATLPAAIRDHTSALILFGFASNGSRRLPSGTPASTACPRQRFAPVLAIDAVGPPPCVLSASGRTNTNQMKALNMDLDMYAYTTSDNLSTPTDFEPSDCRQIHEWRDHPHLHAWMHQLYRDKGGQGYNFNLATLILTADDLDVLELTLKARRLPETRNPIFGDSIGDQSEFDDDMDFIAKAREAIANGETVFYWAWW